MDTNAYRCGWRRIGETVEIWLIEQSKVRAVGQTFYLAEEQMREAIREFNDDWSPHLEFWPLRPPRLKEQLRFSGDWLILSPVNSSIPSSIQATEVYDRGACEKCGTAN